eukprot:1899487-Karenia_brevis.AAC.1
MPHYDVVIPRFRVLCKFLRRQSKKLCSRCFNTEVGRQFHADFEHFKGKVVPGRWDSIAHGIHCLLKVEAALRWGWNLDLFSQGSVAQRQDDDEQWGGDKLTIVDTAIHDVRCTMPAIGWTAVPVISNYFTASQRHQPASDGSGSSVRYVGAGLQKFATANFW